MTTHHPTQANNSPSSNPDPSDKVMYVSEAVYNDWTKRWKDTMSKKDSNINELFTDTVNGDPGYLQLGVGYDSKNILNFLSTVGLSTIHATFGIDENKDKPKFKLILFGRDEEDTIITPYMVGCNLYDNTINSIKIIEENWDKLGQVPKQLADQWVKNWHDSGRSASTPMFTIPNGEKTLEAYAYNMRELLNTLFMNEETDDVFAIFGLHQYPAKEPTSGSRDSVTQIYTFGLLLLGIHDTSRDINETGPNRLTNHVTVGKELEVTGGYYDFSAPCPGTC